MFEGLYVPEDGPVIVTTSPFPVYTPSCILILKSNKKKNIDSFKA